MGEQQMLYQKNYSFCKNIKLTIEIEKLIHKHSRQDYDRFCLSIMLQALSFHVNERVIIEVSSVFFYSHRVKFVKIGKVIVFLRNRYRTSFNFI